VKYLPHEDVTIAYARDMNARAARANFVDPETGMPLPKDPRRSGILELPTVEAEPETVVCNTCGTTVVVGKSCPVCSNRPPDDALVILHGE
jgi:rubrerythrin